MRSACTGGQDYCRKGRPACGQGHTSRSASDSLHGVKVKVIIGGQPAWCQGQGHTRRSACMKVINEEASSRAGSRSYEEVSVLACVRGQGLTRRSACMRGQGRTRRSACMRGQGHTRGGQPVWGVKFILGGQPHGFKVIRGGWPAWGQGHTCRLAGLWRSGQSTI